MVDKQINESYKLLGNYVVIKAVQDLLDAKQNKYMIEKQLRKIKYLKKEYCCDSNGNIGTVINKEIADKEKKLLSKLAKQEEMIKSVMEFISNPYFELLCTMERKDLLKTIDSLYDAWKKNPKKKKLVVNGHGYGYW